MYHESWVVRDARDKSYVYIENGVVRRSPYPAHYHWSEVGASAALKAIRKLDARGDYYVHRVVTC